MIRLWFALLFVNRGSALVPVTTAQLGGPVTFTCVLPKTETGRRDIHWYHQRAGDTLKIIWTLKESATPKFGPAFDNSRWEANYDKNVSNLTILRTNHEDEGIYHCGFTEWLQDTTWTGTYLLVKENTQRISNYTVVQEKTIRLGDSVTLQCSVLSGSVNKTCPGGLEVFWFKEGSHRSHPSIIYTDGNGHHECKKRSETEKSCAYRFSKNISSSDAGTYYCAVATCGEILYGKGSKLDIQGCSVWSQSATTVILLLCPVLVLIVIAVLAYTIKKTNSDYCKGDGLQLTLEWFTAKCEAVGMRINTSTSEAKVLSRKRVECPVRVRDEFLPQVEEFKCLWVLFMSDGNAVEVVIV
ncbi:signal-regulatory protein beta-2-like [Neolamprologus brichardi]|uniref:signal-regulatory protein beta-2-like n=1 Tax=Neolamprologus brichardi TaxID=32507 RepID=UPI0016437861|nr:signal-regulatory protein beta-2-like [Neolamprologus brichardi]